MSLNSYIIKFISQEEYGKHKEYLTELGEYCSITRNDTVMVMHRLTFEDSQKIRELGINISHDSSTINAL